MAMSEKLCSCAAPSILLSVAAILGASIAGFAAPIALKVQPPPSNQVNQAIQLLRQGKLKEADDLFAKAANNDPGRFDAPLGRAQIAIDQHQLSTADQLVTASLKSHDTLPEAHDMKGLILLLEKNNDGARGEFARAIQLRPDYITPRLYLSVMARAANDYNAAAAQYKGVTQVAPRLPAGYLGEAEALTLMHREPDALNVLESWKVADPTTLVPYQVIAHINLSDRKPQDAIRQMQAAVAKAPRDSASQAVLGEAYAAAGDNHDAISAYQSALTADPANTNAALRLGALQAASGQADAALARFRQVLAHDPNNAVAANDAAWLLASQGKDLNEALRLAQQATKSNAKYADAWDTLGWIHYRRGEYPAAVVSLKQAKALSPASPDVAAHLGLAYAKTGNKSAALTELKQALNAGNSLSNRADVQQALNQLSAPGKP